MYILYYNKDIIILYLLVEIYILFKDLTPD